MTCAAAGVYNAFTTFDHGDQGAFHAEQIRPPGQSARGAHGLTGVRTETGGAHPAGPCDHAWQRHPARRRYAARASVQPQARYRGALDGLFRWGSPLDLPNDSAPYALPRHKKGESAMAVGTNIKTYFNGAWHDGGRADHGGAGRPWRHGKARRCSDGARYCERPRAAILSRAHCDRGRALGQGRYLGGFAASRQDRAGRSSRSPGKVSSAIPKDAARLVDRCSWGIDGGAYGIIPGPKRPPASPSVSREVPLAAPEATVRLTTTPVHRPGPDGTMVQRQGRPASTRTTRACWPRPGPRA